MNVPYPVSLSTVLWAMPERIIYNNTAAREAGALFWASDVSIKIRKTFITSMPGKFNSIIFWRTAPGLAALFRKSDPSTSVSIR